MKLDLSTNQSNEFNLLELYEAIVKSKIIIIIMTSIITFGTVIYAWIAKPIYSGDVYVEIGQVFNKSEFIDNVFDLDSADNLMEIVKDATGVEVSAPDGTSNILRISTESLDKVEIKTKLDRAVAFILKRHVEKAKFYQSSNSRVYMSKVIRKVHIEKDPIKPNKKLIVILGFITGLTISILIAFFRDFIVGSSKFA